MGPLIRALIGLISSIPHAVSSLFAALGTLLMSIGRGLNGLVRSLGALLSTIGSGIASGAMFVLRTGLSLVRTSGNGIADGAMFLLRGARFLVLMIGHGIVDFGRFIIAQARRALSFLGRDIRANYDVIGQYTAPLENELAHRNPPSTESINPLARILLTIINVPVWIAALTIIPLIYNSILSISKGFKGLLSLPTYDLQAKDNNTVKRVSL